MSIPRPPLRYCLTIFTLLFGSFGFAQNLDSIRALPNDTVKVRLLKEAGLKLELNDLNDALPVYREALALAERTGAADDRAKIAGQLGVIYTNKMMTDSARILLESALEYYRRQGQPRDEVDKLISLSFNEVMIQDYVTGMRLAQRADSLAAAIDYPQGQLRANAAMGNVNMGLQDRPGFQRYYTKTLELARQSGDDNYIADMTWQLADDHYRYNELDRVEPLIREGQAAARRIGSLRKERRLIGVLAMNYTLQDRHPEALALFDSLILLNGGVIKVGVLANRSMLYRRMGRGEAAGRDLRAAMDTLLKVKNLGVLSQVYRMAEAQYREEGDMDSAYLYANLNSDLKDTLYINQRADVVSELETKYETAAKEDRIVQQDQELGAQRTRLWLIGGLLLLACSAGVIFFLLSQRLAARNRQNEQLVREKQGLIGEIHHRVKNNLQVISSLLQLQGRGLDDDDLAAKDALRESQARVQAMGLIHQKLYQGEEVTTVRMPDYLAELGDTLLNTYRLEEQVEIYCDVEDITLDVDTAIPVGLIVNELVTNSLKYAFTDGRAGTIEIVLRQQEDKLVLQVSDDGVGQAGAPVLSTSTSFGSHLVELLTKKLRGALQIVDGEGYATRIEFRLLAEV